MTPVQALKNMGSRLDQIQNWPELARLAGYSASKLAKNCDVSLRTLQRFFPDKMGKTPKAWLAEQRQLDAVEVLKKCSCVKQAASNLGYKHTHHFSRDFKDYWGYCPTQPAPMRAQTP
jgi:transcriptional regulator GlxA family with amidase domain